MFTVDDVVSVHTGVHVTRVKVGTIWWDLEPVKKFRSCNTANLIGINQNASPAEFKSGQPLGGLLFFHGPVHAGSITLEQS